MSFGYAEGSTDI